MRLLTVRRISNSRVASRLLCWFLLVAMVIPAMADQSSQGQKTEPDLSAVALEDLLNIEVAYVYLETEIKRLREALTDLVRQAELLRLNYDD